MRPESPYASILALALLTTATAVAAEPSRAKPARYTAEQMIVPAGANCLEGFQRVTFARRLNERAEVIGTLVCHITTNDPAFPILQSGSHAYRWDSTTGATLLPTITPDALQTFGRDINESGSAVGWEFTALGGVIPPLWPRAGGVSEAFQPNPCVQDLVLAFGESINDRGAVLGRDWRNGAGGCNLHWVLRLPSGEEIVGPSGSPRQLNNNNVAIGQRGKTALRWSPATGEVVLFQDPAGQMSGVPWQINDRNQGVGQIARFDGGNCSSSDDAVFWAANGALTTLGKLPGYERAVASGINNKSQVVGQSFNQVGCDVPVQEQSRAVIWRGVQPVDLNTLVPRRFAREFQLTGAAAINDCGQILVRAISRDEPKLPCPRIDSDPETGDPIYNPSATCHNEYSFLLTPTHY